jgi:peptidoglycan/xylan/chitin deacetylase (PgdA/CDA1 family)
LKKTIRRITRSIGGSNAARRFVRRVARDHGLRCILYHEIADSPSAFTAGLNVTTSPDMLADHLEMLAGDYDFVSLDQVLERRLTTRDGRPAILVTFDDAYESVASVAADVCRQAGVPSVFFVNGAFVDNVALAFDNLVAWVFNTHGMARVDEAAGRRFGDLAEFFGPYLASITLAERMRVHDRLAVELPRPPAQIAAEESLYVTSAALARLPATGMTVGNHTWSHVYCRRLDEDTAATEIGENRRFLESIVPHPIDAFSYPYGSRLDATDDVTATLAESGHRMAFLVEAEANRGEADSMRLSRVSVGAVETQDLFTDLEVLPVLRRARNAITRRTR